MQWLRFYSQHLYSPGNRRSKKSTQQDLILLVVC